MKWFSPLQATANRKRVMASFARLSRVDLGSTEGRRGINTSALELHSCFDCVSTNSHGAYITYWLCLVHFRLKTSSQ